MRTLYLIPARGGSKGIPGKNIKLLGGRPLIQYSIDVAREVADVEDICVSTDSEQIAEVARTCGIEVPFLRPAELSGDCAGSREVMLHALDYFAARGRDYERIVLLQPTSPMRTADDLRGALELWTPSTQMVVSVCEAATNPYYTAYETDAEGYLHISKGDGLYTTRQACPKVWEYNGAIYVISVEALRQMPLGAMKRRVPYVMPRQRSIDLDTPIDWMVAEALMANK